LLLKNFMSKTVIITGATQGIGKATAILFARNGYNIVLAARQQERLEATASEIRALGREALPIATDVRDPEQVKNLVEKALAHFGHIDVLINNAGIFFLGPVEESSLSDWHQVTDTNLWGYIYTIHALLPYFLQRGEGTIVNVSSIGGLNPIPFQIPYTTSKYAVTGLTKALRSELLPKGIRVCGIYPSFIRTRLIERALFRGKDEEMARKRYQLVDTAFHSPLLEKPEDVAKAIWQAVKYQRSDVLVGTAKFWTSAFHLFPGLMKSIIRQVFGMRERYSDQ
jgi:NAD(P)-dependent dehydrogenase (short-subunit alcohol dehydrogenase family)